MTMLRANRAAEWGEVVGHVGSDPLPATTKLKRQYERPALALALLGQEPRRHIFRDVAMKFAVHDRGWQGFRVLVPPLAHAAGLDAEYQSNVLVGQQAFDLQLEQAIDGVFRF